MAFCSSNYEDILSPYSFACASASLKFPEYTICPLCATPIPLYGLCESKQTLDDGDIACYFCQDAYVSANSLLDLTSPLSGVSRYSGPEIEEDPSPHSSRPLSDCSTVTGGGEAVRHPASSVTARSQEAHRSLDIPSHSTALRSPFVYQPLTQLNHVSSAGHSSANDDTPHPDIFSPTPSPIHTAPNPTENTSLPRRRLSYEPEPYRGIRFEQDTLLDTPRRRRESQEMDCDWGQWIEEMDQPVPNNRLCYSEPSRRKPRLLPDFCEEDETIEEAQIVTMSPSKPRMTSIQRRRANTSPADTTAGSIAPHVSRPCTPSNLYPDTPPTSPDHSTPGDDSYGHYQPQPIARTTQAEATTSKLSKEAREQQAFNRIKSRSTWSMTPPGSGSPTPRGLRTARPASSILETSTVRHIPSGHAARKRPSTPTPFLSPPSKPTSPRGDLNTQILTNLETALQNPTPDPKLRFDDPAVHQLRQLSTSTTTSTILGGPLNSHTTLTTLQQIFPSTPSPLLSSLHAALLTAQHLPSLLHPTDQATTSRATPTQAPAANSPPPPPPGPPHRRRGNSLSIPSKARAMLGFSSPPSSSSSSYSSSSSVTDPPQQQQRRRRSVSSSRRPPLPSYWVRRQQAEQWEERVRDVGGMVEGEVGRVMGMCCVREGEVMAVLARAVGEVVRLSEREGGCVAGE